MSMGWGGVHKPWPRRRRAFALIVAGRGSGERWWTPHWLGVDAVGVEFGGTGGDELAARGDVAAHQQVEDLRGLFGVFDADPAKHPVLGIHGGLGQLVGVHLAEALVALHRLLPRLAATFKLDQPPPQLTVG